MKQRNSGEGDDVAGLDVSCRLRAALYLSECLMKAVRLRKESRGSHYRWDYPEKKENFPKRILSVWDDGVKNRLGIICQLKENFKLYNKNFFY